MTLRIGLFITLLASLVVHSQNEIPCDSLNTGPLMHFEPDSYTIKETPCDSLSHLVALINPKDTSKWVIIGVLPEKTNAMKKRALYRADIVKAELVKRGISPSRLQIAFSHHPKPPKDKPQDWPYYPAHIPYEIGVYLMTND